MGRWKLGWRGIIIKWQNIASSISEPSWQSLPNCQAPSLSSWDVPTSAMREGFPLPRLSSLFSPTVPPGSDPHQLFITPHQPQLWWFFSLFHLLHPHLIHLPCCSLGSGSMERSWPCLSHAELLGLVYEAIHNLTPCNSPGASTSPPCPKTQHWP